ncbi:MAG: FAD-dependent oxidoreductase [Alphaproteobacteria bacterium]
MSVRPPQEAAFGLSVPILIVGGGACGLITALAAHAGGCEAVIVERDPLPAGSTALSSGMIPAAGTRQQAALGVEDSARLFARDVMAKTRERADPAMVAAICEASGPSIDWLTDECGIELELVEGFLYPGHSRLRMHAPPGMTGARLMDSLRGAAEARGIEILTNARATDLFADPGGRVHGIRIERPDGSAEDIGCAALVLACNGFGGNKEMLAANIPEMTEALYFGHAGNRGEAARWGLALGAETRHMTAYQGHGSVAHPHGILITWALMMEGGIQVNAHGQRFSNEHEGYSEQAVAVLAQPDKLAWDIYDARLHELGLGFDDYRGANDAGAVLTAATPEALARACGLPEEALAASIAEAQALAQSGAAGPFGRSFDKQAALAPPYYAIKVTGALFHTQGGLVVDEHARVLRKGDGPLPNLFAGGGAACGVSGPEVAGYLSGNGLLTAVVLGRLAGMAAAELVGRGA